MRRPTRWMMPLTCSAIVFVGAACQADGAADIAGDTTIEGPTTVTEPTSEPTTDPTDESTAPASTSAPTTPAPDPTTAPTSPSTAASTVPPVLATNPPARTVAPAGGSTETVYEVGMIDQGLAPFVTMASADLAERLDVGTDSIEVLTAVLVTWPDAALGCPQPDMAYAQVVTDGSVIELGVDGLVYRYHSGGSRTPFPCDRPLNPVPTPA